MILVKENSNRDERDEPDYLTSKNKSSEVICRYLRLLEVNKNNKRNFSLISNTTNAANVNKLIDFPMIFI